MPSMVPNQGNRLGYALPTAPQMRGTRGMPFNPLQSGRGAPQTPFITQPTLDSPSITLGWPAYNPAFSRPEIVPFQRSGVTRTGAAPRINPRTGRGVAAQIPQLYSPRDRYASQTHATPFAAGTRGANVQNPLFGRPGFQYMASQPGSKLGPVPKLSWPSQGGQRGPRSMSENRSLGFQPSAHGTVQYMPVNQFDYNPPQDGSFDVGSDERAGMRAFGHIATTIGVGNDGHELVGTYRAHDSIVAQRFFKQGRSAAAWQDQSFGPEYRYLTEPQQVARYNLYTQVALARQPGPNAYFLPYQTQPAIASQLAGTGMGNPLGYGAH